jgi:hypothetical protein
LAPILKCDVPLGAVIVTLVNVVCGAGPRHYFRRRRVTNSACGGVTGFVPESIQPKGKRSVYVSLSVHPRGVLGSPLTATSMFQCCIGRSLGLPPTVASTMLRLGFITQCCMCIGKSPPAHHLQCINDAETRFHNAMLHVHRKEPSGSPPTVYQRCYVACASERALGSPPTVYRRC